MASELRVNTLKDASGNNSIGMSYVAEGSAKAWCYISSSGNTLSDSLNIGSIADNGTGSYQANFTSNMNNVLFSQAITSGSYASSMNCEGSTSDCATSQFRIRGANGNETAAADIPNVYGLVHGDLA